MSRKKKRRSWPFVLVILLLAAGGAWHHYVKPNYFSAAPEAQYASCTAVSGTVSVTVTGSGVLENADEAKVTVPGGLKILSVEAEEGSAAEAGDVLYTLDPDSIKERLFSLEQEVFSYARTLMSRSASDAIYSPAKGRLKAVYAKKGDRVEDVMALYGMLALVSSDEKMAVAVPAVITPGETVDVTFTHAGKEYRETGKADSCTDGVTTVLFSDYTALPGETATVKTKDGRTFSGTVSIHAPLPVYGTEGLIKSADAKENAPLTMMTKLFTLETGITGAAYNETLYKREKAEEELLLLKEYEKNPVIAAPEAGIVYSLALGENGVTVKDSPVAVLHTGGAVKMTVDADETDITSLAVGQPVSVTPDAFPGESFAGTVTRISRLGKLSGSITVYETELTLEGDGRLLEGMRGSAVITTDTRENAVTVPVAVLEEDENGTYVLIPGAAGAEKRYVTTGISDGTTAEITSGLSAGDTVLYTDRGAMDIVTKMMERSNAMMARQGGR